jgi:hypothetical protein
MRRRRRRGVLTYFSKFFVIQVLVLGGGKELETYEHNVRWELCCHIILLGNALLVIGDGLNFGSR